MLFFFAIGVGSVALIVGVYNVLSIVIEMCVVVSVWLSFMPVVVRVVVVFIGYHYHSACCYDGCQCCSCVLGVLVWMCVIVFVSCGYCLCC